MFLQFTGIFMIISVGQMIVATAVMFWYSWQLTIVVLICFLPLVISLRWFASRLSRAYDTGPAHRRRDAGGHRRAGRRRLGRPVARDRGPHPATGRRRHRHQPARQRQRPDAGRRHLRVGGCGRRSRQRWRDRRRSHAGCRRRPVAWAPSSPSPSWSGCSSARSRWPPRCSPRRRTRSPRGVVSSTCSTPRPTSSTPARPAAPSPTACWAPSSMTSRSPTRAGPDVLHDVAVEIAPRQRVAVVGETGSGKTTFAKLLTRLMDPSVGTRAPRWRRHLRGVVRRAAPARADGAAGGLPVRRHAAREPALRPARRRRRGPHGGPSTTSACPTGSPRCPPASTPRSGSAVSRCRRGSGSWSRCCGPRSPIPTSSCSTRPPAPSTRRPSCGPPVRWAVCSTDARASPSRTASPPPRTPTGCWCSTPAVSSEDGTHAELVGAGGVYSRLHASWVAQSRLGRP